MLELTLGHWRANNPGPGGERSGVAGRGLPITLAYKHFTLRCAWNQWLNLPVKFSYLPSDALLCLTLWDCCGSDQRQTSITRPGEGGSDTAELGQSLFQ